MMTWFYERRGAYLRCETREVPEQRNLFDLVILHADGTEQVERFANSELLLTRQEELELTLHCEGWSGPFGRLI